MFINKTPWVVLLLLWMGGSTYWHVCQIKQLCTDDARPAPTVAATPEAETPFTVPGLEFADGSLATFNSPGHLSFAKSGADVNVNHVGPLLDSLSLYLKANPSKRLQLTGFYDGKEQNPSSEANLGLARATSIRTYLTSQGVPTGQFSTLGEEKADLAFTPAGDSLYGGIHFAFLDEVVVKAPAEEELAKGQKFASIFEPMDLYFKTGKTTYIKTAETTEFLQKTKAFLKENPDQKLVITGHTDNVGSDVLNLSLSKKRAAAVKMQFLNEGIAAKQIVVEGQGEAKPIASNETEEGRRTNRRAAIVVKK